MLLPCLWFILEKKIKNANVLLYIYYESDCGGNVVTSFMIFDIKDGLSKTEWCLYICS